MMTMIKQLGVADRFSADGKLTNQRLTHPH